MVLGFGYRDGTAQFRPLPGDKCHLQFKVKPPGRTKFRKVFALSFELAFRAVDAGP